MASLEFCAPCDSVAAGAFGITEMSLFKAKELSASYPQRRNGKRNTSTSGNFSSLSALSHFRRSYPPTFGISRLPPPPSFVPPVSRLDHGDKPVADAVMQHLVHS